MAVEVFSVAVFLVVLRETLEAAIVVAVLLAFLKQTLDGSETTATAYKSMVRQVWVRATLGFLLCLVVGGAVIGTFYRFGRNLWDSFEYYYQGAFYLVAALIITVVGAAFLRIGRMQQKWRTRINEALRNSAERKGFKGCLRAFAGKYAVLALSFITVSREGIEGIIFIAGVSFSAPASSVPLPVFVGLGAGCFVGWLLYKGSSLAKLRVFLVGSTCLLYLVAAGLIARSAWYFEQGRWNKLVGKDVTELGSRPGSYDIDRSVWHLNVGNAYRGVVMAALLTDLKCCSPEFHGGYGWGVFNGILGWTNSATYSTVIAYNGYWIAVISWFLALRFREVEGRWPLMRRKRTSDEQLQGPARSLGAGLIVEVTVAKS